MGLFNTGQSPKRTKFRRKNRSPHETYKRASVIKRCRAPGKPWTKPKAIMAAIEADIIASRLRGEVGRVETLRAFYDFAKTTLQTWGNKGNVALQYAWERYSAHGIAMSEAEVMAAVDSDTVSTWYNETIAPVKVVSTTIVAECSDIERLRREAKKAKKLAKRARKEREALNERLKREREENQRKLAESMAQTRAEVDLMARLRKAVS